MYLVTQKIEISVQPLTNYVIRFLLSSFFIPFSQVLKFSSWTRLSSFASITPTSACNSSSTTTCLCWNKRSTRRKASNGNSLTLGWIWKIPSLWSKRKWASSASWKKNASFLRYTMVENGKKHRQDSHPIINCPTSEGVSKVSEVSERANKRSSKRSRGRERSEQSGTRMVGRARGPVQQSVFLAVINHSVVREDKYLCQIHSATKKKFLTSNIVFAQKYRF